jgi:hypothetical protein
MTKIILIYSCQKNKNKHELLYNLLNNRINDCQVYIIYGNPKLIEPYKIDGKYIYLKCGDKYEHLSQKTLSMLSMIESGFKNVLQVLKCDDDIIPNINKINELFLYTGENNVDYMGIKIEIEKDIFTTNHYNKCTKGSFILDKNYNKPMITHKCVFCPGPLYYLSINSIKIINKMNIDVDKFFYEDVMIGYHLNKNNIFPIHRNIYVQTNSFNENIHNIDKMFKNLFVNLNGRTGNNLFQIMAGYSIAKKNKMNLIIVYNTTNYIIEKFNNIHISKLPSNLLMYNEKKCYIYDDIKLNEDCILNGYFQHKNYIDKETYSSFLMNKTFDSYNSNSYFIHVRRGDYLYKYNEDMYALNYDYYKKAIEYIQNIDSNPFFYIVSDDIDFCKTLSYFENINKHFIENDELDELETLNFMAYCKLGGICANSTFSGWGATLNLTPNKIVIVPKEWIHINYDYEIPFEYTISL